MPDNVPSFTALPAAAYPPPALSAAALLCATQLRRVAQNRAAADSAGGAVNDGTLSGIWETGQNIVIDDYSFNFHRMLFKHGEEQIELSKSEQKLLRILVENRGITLTREKLLDHIWSVDAEFVDENTLSVTVKRLRDKLSAQDRIRTVYGIGYRWE